MNEAMLIIGVLILVEAVFIVTMVGYLLFQSTDKNNTDI